MRQRVLGLVLLACGAVIAYFSVYSPLQVAARHEERVSVSMKGAIMFPVIAVVGVAFTALGERSKSVFGARGEKPSALGWVICGLLIVVGVLVYLWLKSELRRKGYQL